MAPAQRKISKFAFYLTPFMNMSWKPFVAITARPYLAVVLTPDGDPLVIRRGKIGRKVVQPSLSPDVEYCNNLCSLPKLAQVDSNTDSSCA